MARYEITVQTSGGGASRSVIVEATSVDKARQTAVVIAEAEDRAKRNSSMPSQRWIAVNARERF
jgi:hypothetical protein